MIEKIVKNLEIPIFLCSIVCSENHITSQYNENRRRIQQERRHHEAAGNTAQC